VVDFAPVALFVYRRLDLLSRVLDSLEACPEFAASKVFIFSDGPKPSTAAAVCEVRAHLRSRLRPNMQLIEAEKNKGLARSIIDGVTRLCDEFGRVIVLEDDLLVSPALLTWLNAALNACANDPRVMQVSGYMYNVPALRGRSEGLFLPITESWGWATWKRAWAQFDPDAKGWDHLLTDPQMRYRFDLGDVYPYTRMLDRQMRGMIDSWAVRWYWSMFRAGGLTLYPPATLVANEGADALATHASWKSRIRIKVEPAKPPLSDHSYEVPARVEVDQEAYHLVRRNISRSRLFVPPSIETLFVK
jgi:hypothetical protein